jgi:hypothetical protein
VCPFQCIDLHHHCPEWAHEGECHNNPRMMLSTCPKSCNVCGKSCQDSNLTQCAIWGSYECETNPSSVIPLCPRTCGVCTIACTDSSAECKAWALNGECETNPTSMSALCPAACGLCHRIEKDEL